MENYLVSSLIYVTSGVVIDSKHRYKPVGNSICSSNVTSRSADAMDIEPNAPCGLRDDSTLLKRFVDTVNAIIFHCEKETAEERKILQFCEFNQTKS